MDPYSQTNRSYDTDLLILRSMFAVNPATNLPISTGYMIATDGVGGINWVDPILFGGITLPNLRSTVTGLGTVSYVSTSYLNLALLSTTNGLGTIKYVSTSYVNSVLQSTTVGLGLLGYISTATLNDSLQSTLNGLGTLKYISTSALESTTSFILNPSRYVNTTALMSTTFGILNNTNFGITFEYLRQTLTSTNTGLGTLQYISTAAFRSSLISTVQSLGTVGYISSSGLRSFLTSTVEGLGSSDYISTAGFRSSLISTVQSLGTVGYISSSGLRSFLTSTVEGLGSSDYISSTRFIRGLQSTTEGLGTMNYISANTLMTILQSTTTGLGTINYVSSSYLSNYVFNALANVGTSANYISAATLNLSLESTIVGLGTFNYISSSALQSTTEFLLDSSRYVSTGALASTTMGILASATSGVSIEILNTTIISTVSGLASGGANGYTSSLSLQSTTAKLSDMINNMTMVSVDRAGNLVIQGGTISIGSMTGSIIYLSTFLQSSVTYKGTNGTISGTVLPNPITGTNMMFSTCVVPFNTMSSFMNANSRVNLDVFPTFAFNELNTIASNSMMLPMSTFLQYGSLAPSAQNSNLLNYVNTSFLVANSRTHGFSNYFQQQIKLQIPGSAISGNWSNDYILYHYMPSALTFNLYQGLKASSITVQYSSTNSVFISVQNLP